MLSYALLNNKIGLVFLEELFYCFSVVIAVALTAVIYAGSEKFIRVLLNDEEVVMHGTVLLREMSLGILFLAVN